MFLHNQTSDEDLCLLNDATLLYLSRPTAAGYLERRSNLSGWYLYWFSLRGSQLLYFEREKGKRRGLLVGSISLFRCRVGGSGVGEEGGSKVLHVTDSAGKLHQLRAASIAEMRWWASKFIEAKNMIPPPRPIRVDGDSLLEKKEGKGAGGNGVGMNEVNAGGVENGKVRTDESAANSSLLSVKVDAHLKVDHVLFVVAGVGTDSSWLSSNTKHLEENFVAIMEQIYPDVDFRTEILSIEWRSALTSLEVHKRLAATAPKVEDANPFREFMLLRVIDYIYYTHARYRRHILRSVTNKLNAAWKDFCRRRPGFKGKVSVFSHSLGSVLMYDLLCKKAYDDQSLLEAESMRIEFDVANLFAVGSPLGTFINLDTTLGPHLSNPSSLPFKILNVFHPNDPLATRCEPFGDINMADVRPVIVPYWRTMGEHESTVQWLGSIWTGKKSSQDVNSPEITPSAGPSGVVEGESIIDEPCSGKIADKESDLEILKGPFPKGTGVQSGQLRQSLSDAELSRVQTTQQGKGKDGYASTRRQRLIVGDRMRIDYGLQVVSAIEDLSTSWSALKAHTDYWSSRDLMLLVVNQMIKTTAGEIEGGDPWHFELDALIVDENITEKVDLLEKRRKRRNQRAACTIREEGANGLGTSPSFALPKDTASTDDIKDTIDEAVARFATRLVEEAAGLYLLETTYPSVASSGKCTSDGSEQIKLNEEEGILSKGMEGRGSGSWIGGYLSWFGGSGTQVKGVSKGNVAP